MTHESIVLHSIHRICCVLTRRRTIFLCLFHSKPFTTYFKAHPELMPSKGQYINIHSELMDFFARGMFRKLWEATGELIPDPELVAEEATQPVNMERIEGRLRLSVLDRDNDGYVTVDDIHFALRDFLGLSVDDNYKTLAEAVHSCADALGNGVVTVEDFEVFCSGMPLELTMTKRWHAAFPDPLVSGSDNETKSGGAISTETQDVLPVDGPGIKRYNTEPTALEQMDTSIGVSETSGGDSADVPMPVIAFDTTVIPP